MVTANKRNISAALQLLAKKDTDWDQLLVYWILVASTVDAQENNITQEMYCTVPILRHVRGTSLERMLKNSSFRFGDIYSRNLETLSFQGRGKEHVERW